MVEVEVEKEKNFKSKQDIEKYGVGKFVEECKARVRHYADIITEQSMRLAYFMDWDQFVPHDVGNEQLRDLELPQTCHSKVGSTKGVMLCLVYPLRDWIIATRDSYRWLP